MMKKAFSFILLQIFLFSCNDAVVPVPKESSMNSNVNPNAVCTPNKQRCNGDLKQECNLQGQWEDIACPSQFTCQEINGVPSCQEINAMMTVGGSNGEPGTGGNTGGSVGGNTAGNTGGTVGGNTAGNTAGTVGGNTGGAVGGNTAGTIGGSTGGALNDTEPLSCSGGYCPAARIDSLAFPIDTNEARQNGCEVNGRFLGIGFPNLINSILALAYSLPSEDNWNQYLNRDNNPLIILGYLKGWMAQQTGNQVNTVEMKLYKGQRGTNANSFLIDPISINNHVNYPNTQVSNSILRTEENANIFPSYLLQVLALNDLLGSNNIFNVRLAQSLIYGDLTIDSRGFNLENGKLIGYLTSTAIRAILVDFINYCDATPSCASMRDPTYSDIDLAENILISSIGGYDTLITDGGATMPCAGTPECNAISVCMFITMSSVTIEGP